ncbi:MAG: succinylglutamate desuccinylase/aspartoacylase family protein [Cyclobacteriaceae bacterium]
MVEVSDERAVTKLGIKRVIGKLGGERPGPTVVFFGGIHGNEPSGVQALQQVVSEIQARKTPIRGTVYALAGNLGALSRGVRYISSDLNRMWSKEKLEALKAKDRTIGEAKEQLALLQILEDIINKESGPFYFFDLHTTSSDTKPFITINDTRLNRKFALQFPVPIILGIEEFIDGPLLSYINTLGYVAVGFEGGQHDNPQSIENHIAFVRSTLLILGLVPADTANLQQCQNLLRASTGNETSVYEIITRYEIAPGEKFVMQDNFKNFQELQKGVTLAYSENEPIYAEASGRIFLPLYQPQGQDGYFIIKGVHKLFLSASTFLRTIRMDSFLTLLPGIQWMNSSKNVLVVNQKIARFFAKDFLHLMGYRLKQTDAAHLRARKREDHNANRAYRGEAWLK